MKKHIITVSFVLMLALAACAPAAMTPNPEPPVTTQPPTATPYPTNTPTPQPTPTEVRYSGSLFALELIPVGEPVTFEFAGEAFTLAVEGAVTGQEAQALLDTPAPPATTWLVVDLTVTRAPGGMNESVQPLAGELFSIITNGHINPPQPIMQSPPKPAAAEVALLPGGSGRFKLAYLVYRDDPAPVLRFDPGAVAVMFDLLNAGDVVLQPEQDFLPQNDIYTEESPLPPGDALFAQRGSEIFRLQVDQVLRGERAARMLQDVFGVAEAPPLGQEYILPHLSVMAAFTDSAAAELPLQAFASLSQGQEFPAPALPGCPLPCLQSADLLPNGTAAGWLPLLVNVGDANPLLVFDGFTFLTLQLDESPTAVFEPPSGADVIGYATRKQIASAVTLSQAGPVYALAFSPDGALLASGGDDRLVHLWDPATGVEVNALPGFSIRPRAIAFSPDGSMLAAISASNELMIWETAGWQPVFNYDGDGNGLAVRFLPDDTLLTVTTSGTVTLWDVFSNLPLRERRVPAVADPACRNAVVYSFDTDASGELFAASLSCGYGMLWRNGEEQPFYIENNQQVDLPRVRYKPKASSISLSPDGTTATYGMVYFPELWLMTMEVIDVASGNVIAAVSPMDPNLMASAVAPNNDLMFAGVANMLTFWWQENGRWDVNDFIRLEGHAGLITDIAISQDGRQMASADYGGRILIWRVVP